MPATTQAPDDQVLSQWQNLAHTDRLPPQWLADTLQYVPALATRLAARHTEQQQPLVVGINGAQGTGKSTLAKTIAIMLENQFRLKTTVLSLDDFYLGRQARLQLGQNVHPLLVTRGVPGTHDIPQAISTLQQLCSTRGEVTLPGFDKATDDCLAPASRQRTLAPRDVVILEGWCIGVPPQDSGALRDPVNVLEAEEDTDGRWRRHVNDRLAHEYQDLFALIDYLVMLKAPSFDCVLAWRSLQEAKLAAKHCTLQTGSSGIMTPDAIGRFIQHYERLTRHAFATLPGQADAVLSLNADHRISDCTYKVH
ncbi:MAG: hypothetical protein CMQ34_01715 [Gammaproteobacteria bacterium]|nr:hypothetical protein [Gammaproteobacteria bacterium]|tara:strand:- start:198 stop:1124 length:927 start_codon:yes stop_codon:yes gene_type:complete